jgi:hypothetical protein
MALPLEPQDLTYRQLEAEIRIGLGADPDLPWSQVLDRLRGFMVERVAFGTVTPAERWLAECELERSRRRATDDAALPEWTDDEVAA